MSTGYFASLAEKALHASKTDLSKSGQEVSALLAEWGQPLPQRPKPHTAGNVRDDWQEALTSHFPAAWNP